MDVYHKRFGKTPEPENQQHLGDLLRSTMFIDKGIIIRKRDLAKWATSREIEAFFSRGEQLRNWCAHTRDEDEIARDRIALHQFIEDAHKWIDHMASAIPTR